MAEKNPYEDEDLYLLYNEILYNIHLYIYYIYICLPFYSATVPAIVQALCFFLFEKTVSVDLIH